MSKLETCPFCRQQFSKKSYRIHKKHCKKRKTTQLKGRPFVFEAFSIINRGYSVEIAIAEGRPKVKVHRIRSIPDENQIAEITFDEVFNHCGVNDRVILELRHPGKDQILNYSGIERQLEFLVKGRWIMKKENFIEEFPALMLVIAKSQAPEEI